MEKEKNIESKDLIVWWYSVWTAVATDFASKNDFERLVLVSPLSSRYDMSRKLFWFALQKILFLPDSYVTKDLVKKKQLVLGAEMLEADNQEHINQYLSGAIDQEKLDSTVRLWSNYKTDYKPLVDFAKEKKFPCGQHVWKGQRIIMRHNGPKNWHWLWVTRPGACLSRS